MDLLLYRSPDFTTCDYFYWGYYVKQIEVTFFQKWDTLFLHCLFKIIYYHLYSLIVITNLPTYNLLIWKLRHTINNNIQQYNIMTSYSRRWLSLKNDLPEVRNISAKSTSRTCVPAYRANLSIRYFSGSRSRSARRSTSASAVSSADRLIRTPGASWYESAASNSPSTVSISWPCRSSVVDVVAATDSSEPATTTARQSAMATIRAAACVDRFISERRISVYIAVCRIRCCYRRQTWSDSTSQATDVVISASTPFVRSLLKSKTVDGPTNEANDSEQPK